jgi:hypothetical protein
MSLQAHLSELSTKHKALDQRIEKETASPGSDDLGIVELKRKKLRIKDEIARLEYELRSHH